MRQLIEDYWRSAHLSGGYDLLYTPHIANLDLWKTSGHFEFYRDNMFDSMAIEAQQYQLRPMNCPFHVLTYQNRLHSYRELPLRWAELGTVYRYERSGVLHGLMRVRGFTQDDAHVFCLPDQVTDEVLAVLNLTEQILSDFGFTQYEVNLSTRPAKSVGADAVWDLATNALVQALDRKGWDYVTDEGGGAFYGPKIDIKIRDAIGRLWQCSTIQVDFNLPERFDLHYVADDGSRQRPIMIHRAIFGSLERFFGILVENYAGDFPLWLAPVQLRLLPVSDGQRDYANGVAQTLKQQGYRVEVDASGNRLGKQIRTAELEKIPVVAVVGKREVEQQTLSVRSRQDGELGALTVAEVVEKMQLAVVERTLLLTNFFTHRSFSNCSNLALTKKDFMRIILRLSIILLIAVITAVSTSTYDEGIASLYRQSNAVSAIDTTPVSPVEVETIIAYRREHMKALSAHYRSLESIINNNAPFDSHVLDHVNALIMLAQHTDETFPDWNDNAGI